MCKERAKKGLGWRDAIDNDVKRAPKNRGQAQNGFVSLCNNKRTGKGSGTNVVENPCPFVAHWYY